MIFSSMFSLAVPKLSLTLRGARYEPGDEYVCAVCAADAPRSATLRVSEAPSPKLKAYSATAPSESVEPAPPKLTVSGAVPDVGCAVRAATGSAFGLHAALPINW